MSYLFQLQASGKSPATIARHLAALKAFYRFALAEGKLSRDPTSDLDTPKLPQKLPGVLSVQEVDLLLNQPRPGSRPASAIKQCWNCSMPRESGSRNLSP